MSPWLLGLALKVTLSYTIAKLSVTRVRCPPDTSTKLFPIPDISLRREFQNSVLLCVQIIRGIVQTGVLFHFSHLLF